MGAATLGSLWSGLSGGKPKPGPSAVNANPADPTLAGDLQRTPSSPLLGRRRRGLRGMPMGGEYEPMAGADIPVMYQGSKMLLGG